MEEIKKENKEINELLKSEEFMKKYNEFKAQMEYSKYKESICSIENEHKTDFDKFKEQNKDKLDELAKRNREIFAFCDSLKEFDGKDNETNVIIVLTALPPELTFLLEHSITGDVLEGDVDINEELDKYEEGRWPDLSNSATGELSKVLKKCEKKQEEVINYLRSNNYQSEQAQKLLRDIQELTYELYAVFEVYKKSNNNSIKM